LLVVIDMFATCTVCSMGAMARVAAPPVVVEINSRVESTVPPSVTSAVVAADAMDETRRLVTIRDLRTLRMNI
jgi:hypothetical protein